MAAVVPGITIPSGFPVVSAASGLSLSHALLGLTVVLIIWTIAYDFLQPPVLDDSAMLGRAILEACQEGHIPNCAPASSTMQSSTAQPPTSQHSVSQSSTAQFSIANWFFVLLFRLIHFYIFREAIRVTYRAYLNFRQAAHQNPIDRTGSERTLAKAGTTTNHNNLLWTPKDNTSSRGEGHVKP